MFIIEHLIKQTLIKLKFECTLGDKIALLFFILLLNNVKKNQQDLMQETMTSSLKRISTSSIPFCKKKTTTSEYHFNQSLMLISKNKKPSIKFGHLHNYKLIDKIFPQLQAVKEPQIYKLIYNLRNSLACDEKAIELLRTYSDKLIAFVGVYGKKGAGKSFWCDKIYNLAQIQGNLYGKSKSFQAISFLTTPFSKTKGNLKIFLLDCSGFSNSKLTKEQQNRLDMIMLLCSTIVVIPQPEDLHGQIFNLAYCHFKESSKRIRHLGKESHKSDTHWPHNVYCLYRTTAPVKKDPQILGQLFQQFNFAILKDAKVGENEQMMDYELESQSFLNRDKVNEVYMKKTSVVFDDIYQKIKGKKFGNLKSYGIVLQKLIPELKNSLIIRQKIQLGYIVDDTTKKLYAENHRDIVALFEYDFEDQFSDSKIEPEQSLLRELKDNREYFFQTFDKNSFYFDPQSEHHEKYEDKLQKLITDREKVLLQTKRKKAIKSLKNMLPSVENSKDALQYIQMLRSSQKHINYEGRSKAIGSKLKQACLQEKNMFYLRDEQKQIIQQLKKEVQAKEQEVRDIEKQKIKKEEQEVKYTHLSEIHSKLLIEIEDEEREMLEDSKIRKNQELNGVNSELKSRLSKVQKEKKEYNIWLNEIESLNKEQSIFGMVSQIDKSKIEQQRLLKSKAVNRKPKQVEVRSIRNNKLLRSKMK